MKWDLLPGEVLIHEAKASHIYFLKYFAIAVLSFIGFLFLMIFGGKLAGIVPFFGMIRMQLASLLLIISFIMFGYVEFKRNKEKIALTNERILIMKRDPKTRRIRIETIPLDKLIRVSVYQTVWQRLLGTGEIVFQIPGETHTFEHIRNPKELERAVYRILEKSKSSRQEIIYRSA